MNRRTFLRCGACSLVALAGPPRFLVRTAAAAAAGGKVLVAVFQRGAVDGLSMVVPYGDPAYAAARQSIALRPPKRGESDRALDLDGFFALHPGLAPLVPLWEHRSLAIVHACGSPDTTRSHFDAQDYMESGTPGVKSTPDGWLARAVRALPDKPAPFRAVALGPVLPRALQGDAGALTMASIDRFDVRVTDTGARGGFEALYARTVGDLLSGTGRETFEAVRMLRSADAMAAVVALTMSEFGRTVGENGTRGTDHGHATAMLVLGGGVRGGRVHGRWPGLARERLFEARDLAVTTDFRPLFSEVAARHLGVPPASLFPGWKASEPPLGLFA